MALKNLIMLATGVAESAKTSRAADISAAKTEVLTTVKNETVNEAIKAVLDNNEISDLALKSEVSAVQDQVIKNAGDIEGIQSDVSVLQATIATKADAANVYTKSEVDDKLAAIPKFGVEVVEELPEVANAAADKVYLVKTSDTETGNLYTEYILVNGAFEELGTQALDLSNYATKDDLTKYVLTSDIFTSGYFNTVYTHADGSYAKLWNESDGGGAQYFNKSADVISYVGTNDGDASATAIDVQIYSKVKTSNSGVRINVNPNKAYYTKGALTTANGGSEDNEIAVIGDVKAVANEKANAVDVYTKTEADSIFDTKANVADVYSKTDADAIFDTKADAATTYNKTEVDNAIAVKANSADVYTKSETDDALALKANADAVYTKTEVDQLINSAIADVLEQISSEMSN